MLRTLALCTLIGAGAVFAQDSRPAKPDKPDKPKSVMERLKEQKLDMNLPDTPLMDALEFVRMVTDVNLVASPSCDLDAPLSLELKGVPVKDALDQIGSAMDPKLTWSLVDDVVIHFHRVGVKAPKTPKVDKAWLKKNGERTADLNLADTPIEEATEFLTALYGLQVELDESCADASVTLALKKVKLPTLLTLLADQANGTWTVEDGTVHIRPAKK